MSEEIDCERLQKVKIGIEISGQAMLVMYNALVLLLEQVDKGADLGMCDECIRVARGIAQTMEDRLDLIEDKMDELDEKDDKARGVMHVEVEGIMRPKGKDKS